MERNENQREDKEQVKKKYIRINIILLIEISEA
jgi:hypothetical protein